MVRSHASTTALVHEAYLRLVDDSKAKKWKSRGHFFVAAAEAMRRILVEHTRRRLGKQRGGDRQRGEMNDGFEKEVRDRQSPPCANKFFGVDTGR